MLFDPELYVHVNSRDKFSPVIIVGGRNPYKRITHPINRLLRYQQVKKVFWKFYRKINIPFWEYSTWYRRLK